MLLNFISNCINTFQINSNNRYYTNLNLENFFIFSCFFLRFNTYVGNGDSSHSSSTSNSYNYGGIIYIYEIISHFYLLEVTFLNCSCTGRGGAIFFHVITKESSSFLNKVCGFECWTPINSYYPFGEINVFNNKNNNISFLSISKTTPFFGYSNECFYLYEGKQFLNNFNSSFNKVKTGSSFVSRQANQINITFSTFFNNSASSYICISMNENYNSNLSFLNLIGNNSPSYGIFYIYLGIYNFQNSIFFNNINTLLYCNGGTIYLNNCNINHINTIIYGNIITSNINLIFTSSYNFYINFCFNKFQKSNFKKIKLLFFNFYILILN